MGCTAVGLLAVALFRLDSKIDERGRDVSEQMRSLDAKIDSRFDALGARIDTLSAQLAEHLRRHAG